MNEKRIPSLSLPPPSPPSHSRYSLSTSPATSTLCAQCCTYCACASCVSDPNSDPDSAKLEPRPIPTTSISTPVGLVSNLVISFPFAPITRNVGRSSCARVSSCDARRCVCWLARKEVHRSLRWAAFNASAAAAAVAAAVAASTTAATVSAASIAKTAAAAAFIASACDSLPGPTLLMLIEREFFALVNDALNLESATAVTPTLQLPLLLWTIWTGFITSVCVTFATMLSPQPPPLPPPSASSASILLTLSRPFCLACISSA
mmetsp:Transcript_21510/g.47844  ORF Transcript_21510/g.47844 Transcript_21510/m.47844 type:complete len:262 (+) Transcript_21510:63-848(+)